MKIFILVHLKHKNTWNVEMQRRLEEADIKIFKNY